MKSEKLKAVLHYFKSVTQSSKSVRPRNEETRVSKWIGMDGQRWNEIRQ